MYQVRDMDGALDAVMGLFDDMKSELGAKIDELKQELEDAELRADVAEQELAKRT